MSETGFDETPEVTSTLLEDFTRSGFLNIAGGCCGTTPEHIAAIARKVSAYQPRSRANALFTPLFTSLT
jgi:5-methyltetrahydrofolate--homocysteine methyltransferase